MAAVQIKIPSSAGVVREGVKAVVYAKKLWADVFRPQRFVEAVSDRKSVAPTISEASFIYKYGEIKREASNSFSDEFPEHYENWYIQTRAVGSGGKGPLWTGIVTRQSFNILGANGNKPMGDQNLTARGLEHILERVGIRTAHVEQDAAVVEIKSVPTFNSYKGYGTRLIGNRSESEYEDAGVSAYVFGKATQKIVDGDWTPEKPHVWSHLDIIKYLFKYHQPVGGPQFQLTGQFEDLDNIHSIVNVEGLNVKQALDKLILHQFGMGWFASPSAALDDDGDQFVDIMVFPVAGKEISAGKVTLHANENERFFRIDDDIEYDPVVNRKIFESIYRKIIGLGAKIKTCFTLSFVDDTLEKAWKTSEETAYKDEALGDQNRKRPEYSRVYEMLRAKPDWDWQAGNGEGGEKHIANPKCNDDGTLDMTTAAGYYNADKRFLRKLPFLVKTEKDDAEPIYQDHLILIQDPKRNNAYCQVDKPERKDRNLKINPTMADREMAIILKVDPNHLLGLNHFNPVTAAGPRTGNVPEYDYEDVVATVFAETDERLRVEESIEANPRLDASKDLVLVDETAELWFCTPGTVIGVKNGELVHYEDEHDVLSTDLNKLGPYALRDDSDRLRAIVAFAKAWYGVPRSAITLTARFIGLGGLLGHYVSYIKSGWQKENVNTPVTEIAHDYQAGTTTVFTGYFEIDFQAMIGHGRIDVPGMSDLASVGKAFHRQEMVIEKIRDRVADIPSSFTDSPLQLISDDKHVEDSTPDHNSIIRRQTDGIGAGLFTMIVPRARPGDDEGYHLDIIQDVRDPGRYTGETKYGLMWHVNDNYTSPFAAGSDIAASAGSALPSNNAGWMVVPGDPNEAKFERDDKPVNVGRVSQIGDIITLQESNKISTTADQDKHVKTCIRQDAMFFYNPTHDGRIYFTTRDISSAIEGSGQIIKGEMAPDKTKSRINSLSGHASYQSCVWLPIFQWPVQEFQGAGEKTIAAGDKITIDAYGLITNYVPNIA